MKTLKLIFMLALLATTFAITQAENPELKHAANVILADLDVIVANHERNNDTEHFIAEFPSWTSEASVRRAIRRIVNSYSDLELNTPWNRSENEQWISNVIIYKTRSGEYDYLTISFSEIHQVFVILWSV